MGELFAMMNHGLGVEDEVPKTLGNMRVGLFKHMSFVFTHNVRLIGRSYTLLFLRQDW